MKKEHYAIAIDGPAGAGKSTVAKRVAQVLGCVYVDTGAIYRAVGYQMQMLGIGPKDTDGIKRLIGDVNVTLQYDEDGVQHTILNGYDVSQEIRTPEMSKIASTISAQKVVRDYLLEVQRAVAKNNNVIMDGRDIGTVVLPDADVKIFLTAEPEQRARRRYLEQEQRGCPQPYEQVLQEICQRDKQDSGRAIAPLKCAKDAVKVDTSQLDFEASVEAVLQVISAALDGK